MKILRIGELYSFSYGGNGAGWREYNVLRYLAKKADVTFIPLLNSICLREEAKDLEEYEKIGVDVPERVYDFVGTCKPTINPVKSIKRELLYFNNFVKEAKDSDLIMSNNNGYLHVKVLSTLKEKIKRPTISLVQAHYTFTHSLRGLLKTWNQIDLTILFLFPLYILRYYERRISLLNLKNIDLLIGVSYSAIQSLFKLGLRDLPPYYVLRPSNAFDEELLNYSTLDKENYAVFFARLVPEKGIFDLPKIWKLVREELPNSKLIILGRFFNETIKRKFLSMVQNDPSIEYKGFVTREELYKIVSKARVTIYPSYEDFFSLVALESLALKTPIVAYDIPALREFYSQLKAVRLIEPKNYKAMASEIIKLLRMKTEDYQELFDEEYKEFIKLHSSWERVAEEEYKAIKEFLERKR